MSIHTSLKSQASTSARRVKRLCLEPLEDRCVPAFEPLTHIPVGQFPSSQVAADFNGDGRLDLATNTVNAIAVSLGNGDGTFQPARYSPSGGSICGTGDLNGDARPDLVSINGISLNLTVQLGNGDGTFQAGQAIVLPSQLLPGSSGLYPVQTPTSVAVADLDADGTSDLIAGGYDVEEIGYEAYRHDYINVRLGNGDGTFGPNTAYLFGNTFDAAVLGAGDFDGDGTSDVLAGGGGRLSVFSGNGDGTLRTPRTSDVGFLKLRTASAVADFDRDGRLDVLSGNNPGTTVSVMRGHGDGTFSPTGAVSFGATVQTVAVGDVDADGDSDVVGMVNHVVIEYADEPVTTRAARVLLGDGSGSFAPPVVSMFEKLSAETYFQSAVLANFDGDQFPELAVSEFRIQNGFGSSVLAVAPNDGVWVAPPPSITLSDGTVTEGHTGTRTATFTVTLSAVSTRSITVTYATAGGTATGGSDYQSTTGTLTIPAGQTTGTITVLVTGDRLAEPNETFVLNLSSPTNATLGDGQGVGTIVDDEPRVSIGDVSKKEGRRGQTTFFTFTVTLSAAYDQAVTMSYATANGTAKTTDNDYVAATGALTFAPGETTKTVTIEVKGDSRREANETFSLDLFGNSFNSLFTKSRGLGTILNDD